MPKAPRKLQSNFSKGELSPRLEGRPDLALYFEGCRVLENWIILRQGGVTRRPGTRFLAEVKNSSQDTILLPFQSSVEDAYVLEMGNTYLRVYKDKARVPVSAGGPPVEEVTPYTTAQLRTIHTTQSVDVAFLFHPDVPQQRLSRASDTSWAISASDYNPPPSYLEDTDISRGASAGLDATLTPGATSGTNVVCTASQAVFLPGDVGRQIIAGTARAQITGLGLSAGDTTSPNTNVRATVLDAFPDTDPIAAGDWLLRLSPQVTLLPSAKEPVGASMTLTAGANAFRGAANNTDVGKYVKVYGGLFKITAYTSATAVQATLLTAIVDAPETLTACPVGAWTLEVSAWSAARGYPRTGEFYQGRLAQAASPAQPTTIWMSASNDYENYGEGTLADTALEYTIAARQINRIQWLAEHRFLFPGTADIASEIPPTVYGQGGFLLRGPSDQPLGGANLPLAERVGNRELLFVNASRLKVYSLAYTFTSDTWSLTELTAIADHITAGGIRLGPVAYRREPDPTFYWILETGEILVLTYYPAEKVVGFSRVVTDGAFEAVAVIPGGAGENDVLYVIVRRTINRVTKRYVEVVEEDASELTARAWTTLQTDCALTYVGPATTTITGLSHLEGKTVDVISGGGSRAQAVVTGGQITLAEAVTQAEIGLPYTSTLQTMRPASEQAFLDGLPRSWATLWLRLMDSLGGRFQAGSHATFQPIPYPPGVVGRLTPFSGALQRAGQGWDQDEAVGNDGSVTVIQDQPYPITLLGLFGDLVVGDA